MLYRGKSEQKLKLNSYKIDHTFFRNNLEHLNDVKSELQSTISNYRKNQNHYLEENQRLRSEIKMLQKKFWEKQEHKNCQKKMKMLEIELMNQKEETFKYRQMYETEKRNKSQINFFYQRKLDKYENDSKILMENYEQRITSLKNQLSQAHSIQNSLLDNKSRVSDISKMNQNCFSHTDNNKLNIINECGRQNSHDSSLSFSPYKSMNKSNKRIPPKSPRISNIYTQRTKQYHQFPPSSSSTLPTNANDEQTFQCEIKKLCSQFKALKITSRQALFLPIFVQIKQTQNITKSDLSIFFRTKPFEIKDKFKIEQCIRYTQELIRNKFRGKKINGRIFSEFFIDKIEELQGFKKNDCDDLEISGMTSSQGQSSYSLSFLSQSNKHKSKESNYPMRSVKGCDELRISTNSNYHQ